MATIDEILSGSQGGGSQPTTSAANGTQERSEQNSGKDAPVTKITKPNVGKLNVQLPQKAAPLTKKVGKTEFTMEEIYDRLNPERPMTKEELEKERKKHKRNKLFAAIGDGVSALANLFFTTQYAPNMYSGKNTMSERAQIRYDRLMKENDAKRNVFFDRLVKARQADEAKAEKERAWQYQLGLDEAKRKAAAEQEKAKQAAAKAKQAADLAYKRERAEKADEQWQMTFDANQKNKDRDYNLKAKIHNDNKELQKQRIKATGARGVRGKQLGFADGQGNQVSIYENVWKGSMQQVYDAMVADGVGRGDLSDSRWKTKTAKMTPAQKEDYVKQNWHKSPNASGIMLALSKLDPATMTSEISDDEDYSQYEDNGDEEDYSQYEV